MMVGVGVIRLATVRVPMRHLGPSCAAVGGEMKVHSSTDHDIWIRRMDRDRIPVRNLPFLREFIARDVLPCGSAIGRPEHSQQEVALTAVLILSKSVKDTRVRWANGQRCSSEGSRIRKGGRDVCPGCTSVVGAPNSIV